MDIRTLQYFLAVAREESISGAAEFLHMTQPPLSRQLKELEAELGKQLFIRGNRKITLTEDGMILRKRAEEIVAKLNERTECKVTLHDFSDPEVLRASIAESTILVNGTSVGMAPNVDRTIITDTSMFHKDLFVFDVIYNPQETRLLREAKEAGCKTGNGMYMLLYQGAASFKLWTGEDMPVEIIKEKYFSGK